MLSSPALLLLALLGNPWTTHGPHGGTTTALAAAAPQTRVLYAANAAGVFRSDDGGASWRATGELRDVILLAVDPVDPNIVFAAREITSEHGEVYRTQDGGATWTLAELPSPLRPKSIVIDPSDHNTIYVASKCQPYFKGVASQYHDAAGVFRSIDGGATWENFHEFAFCAEELSLDPRNPSHLYAATDWSGRAESFDRGQTWTTKSTTVALPTRRVVAHPTDPNVRYGIYGLPFASRFMTSTDGGLTWTVVTPAGVTGDTYASLDLDPLTRRLFLGTNEGLFRSGDGGRTWLRIEVPRTLVAGIALDSATRSVIAGTAFGIFESAPPYSVVEPVVTTDASTNVARVVVDAQDPRMLYAATLDNWQGAFGDGRVFRSSNGGRTWQLIQAPVSQNKALMAVDGAGDIYAARYNATRLSRLRKGENAFEELPHPFEAGITAVAADQLRPGWLYLLSSDQIYTSRNGGQSWLAALRMGSAQWLAVHEHVVYVANSGNEIIRSDDGGDTWSGYFGGQFFGPLAIAPSDPMVVYALFRSYNVNVVARSENGGARWETLTSPAVGDLITAMAVDPEDPRRVWAGTASHGVFVSHDGGIRWTDMNQGLPTRTIQSIAFDPNGNAVHIGT
ncbi:MAG: WD40/YVTN/BNR-like repeat-containing protein, partial [Thermoanaerobaculia bacterium]